MKKNNLDRETKQALARGIALGMSTLELAGQIGVDRSTLRGWMQDADFMCSIATSLRTPRDLGNEAEARLRIKEPLYGERAEATAARMELWRAVQERFAEWYAKERDRAERRWAAAERRAERREREQTRREAEIAECLDADFFNLQTLCIVEARTWSGGSADELARGLDTPEKRRAYRCKHGIKWECAGFGPYFAPTWSANRCEMRYVETDAESVYAGFAAVVDNPRFKQAWREAESAQSDESYHRDPFRDRDPLLPVVADKAKRLLEIVERGNINFKTAVKKAAAKPKGGK